MPRIDPYQSQVRLDGTLGVRASADDFGGASARAMQGLGNELDQTADTVSRVKETKARMRASAELTQADLDWRQEVIKRQSDPEFAKKYGEDGAGFADAFKQDFEKYATETLGKTDPRQRKYMEAGLYNLGEGLMAHSMEYQAKVGAEFAVDTVKKTVDNARQSANMSPDQYASIMANAQLVIQNSANLDPTTRRRMSEAATEDVTIGAALGVLQQRGVAGAQAIMDNKLSFPVLDRNGKTVMKSVRDIVSEETYKALYDQSESTIKKAQSEANEARSIMISDMETAIEFAETPEDFIKIGEAIEEGEKTFGHIKTNDLRVKLYKKSKDQREQYASIERGNAFATGNGYLNPTNEQSMKDYNLYYDREVAPMLPDMEPDERNTRLANMIATTKVIPDSLKGDIKIAARSLDPKLVVSTADFVDRLRNTNPHLVQDIDSKDLARVDMVNQFIASGYNGDEALKKADELIDPSNTAMIEQRKEGLKEMKVDYRGKALGNFTTMWAKDDTTSPVVSRQISQLQADYQNAYDTHYKLTGNETLAEKHANTVVSGLYGVTHINGTRQVMRYAPEKYYGIENTDNDWITKQLHEDIDTMGPFMVPEGTNIKDKIVVIPDASVTSRTAKQGQPVYKLFYRAEDGSLSDLLGNGKYWKPDPQKKRDELTQHAKDLKDFQEKVKTQPFRYDMMGP